MADAARKGELLATVPCFDGAIRVTLEEYDGHPFVQIERTKGNTRKSVAIGTRALGAVTGALVEAQRRVGGTLETANAERTAAREDGVSPPEWLQRYRAKAERRGR